MSDPFTSLDAAPAAPAAGDAPPPDAVDPHLLVARASLALAAVWALLFAQAVAVTGCVVPQVDPEFERMPAIVGPVLGVAAAVPLVGVAAFWAAGAALIGRPGALGRGLGIAGHALLVTTCSPVLGAHGLYALLTLEQRR